MSRHVLSVLPGEGSRTRWKFKGGRFYSRAEDFFKIEDLLDVVHLLLPRLSSAGVSVLSSHGAAASPATSPADSCGEAGWKRLREDGRMRRNRTKGEFQTKRKKINGGCFLGGG